MKITLNITKLIYFAIAIIITLALVCAWELYSQFNFVKMETRKTEQCLKDMPVGYKLESSSHNHCNYYK